MIMTRDSSLRQQEQSDKLMQIGAYLRQVREDYGWSLEEVAGRTLIQARLLRAIEDGKIQHLPEPVYIQGFIRRYAEVLGLDGSAFADAFPTQSTIRFGVPSWKESPAAQLRPLHLYVAYIALIVASVSLLSHMVNRSASSPFTSSGTNSQILVGSTGQAVTSAPGTASAVKPTTVRTGLNAVNSASRPLDRLDGDQPVRVEIKLTAQSWLEVEVDGDVKLADVLPEGTERSWTAKSQLRLRAGNAGGVMLTYNGGRSEQMGPPGAVEEKVFSAPKDTASLPPDQIPIVAR
jgi:cytoskeletal protein RodZ